MFRAIVQVCDRMSCIGFTTKLVVFHIMQVLYTMVLVFTNM